MRSAWKIETMVLTKPNKDKETYASTVAFESCCYIKLEKHKLDQIAERKIRISLDRLEVKLQRLRRKGTRANMISVLYSQTVSNHCLRRCQNPRSNTQITAKIL